MEEAVEFLGEGGGGGEAAGRVFLQALQAERVEGGGDLAVELRRRRRVRIQNLLHEQLRVSLGAEGAFAGQQLEQNHPHGPSVRAAIDGVAVLPLLRRHVLAGDVRPTVHLADFIGADNVPMLELRGRSRFTSPPRRIRPTPATTAADADA